MDSTATAGGFSLKRTFNKVNHWRHWLMDISMIGMAIGALVATGGATGFLDPVWGWMKMHFTGLGELWNHGSGFLQGAFQSASNGVWFTGAEAVHNMHASLPLTDPTFVETASRFGMSPGEYTQGWLFGHGG